jgi:RNA polymerase sigma-70 factor (ECF subfamily)
VRGLRRGSPTAIMERPVALVTDAALVAAAQVDRTAFASLFDRYWDHVFRFCFYRVGDWQEAEDAASQIFVNALDALGRFQIGERDDTFRCWLFAIAYRVIANTHRHRARHPTRPIEAAAGRSDPAPSPEEQALAVDDHRRLYALLEQLTPDQRELLELRLAGLTAVEIAQVLGRSHDAIRKAESRAVRTLRNLLDDGVGAKEAIDG